MKTVKPCRRPREESGLSDATAETLRLYHAWLGYLLTKAGKRTLRVPAAAITGALDHFTCTVRRDGGDYVIHLHSSEKEPPHADESH